MKGPKSFFKILFGALYFICLLALLFSYAASYINPKTFWLFAFFGIAYPVLLLLNLVFLIWWAVQKNKLFWISLICIVAGYNHIAHFFLFNFFRSSSINANSSSIKVLSYNVRLFDLYNWTGNKQTRSHLLALLNKESADIVCLQEYFQRDNDRFNMTDTLDKLLAARSHHVVYTLSRKKKDHWGIATFSKYEMVNKGRVPFKYHSNNICIFSDLKIGNDTVRIYNLHLQSISFGYAEYKFIETLKENNEKLDVDDIELGSKNILRQMKRAFIKRASQTEKIIVHVDSCKYPVIICGDFNDTPFSFTYRKFSKRYKDAFLNSGSGLGRTYNGEFPSYRIDYIFYSNQFTSKDFQVLPEEYSDHYPISCNIIPRK